MKSMYSPGYRKNHTLEKVTTNIINGLFNFLIFEIAVLVKASQVKEGAKCQ